MAEKPVNTWRATMKRRLAVTAAVFGLWTVAIEGRLIYFQILRHAELTERAQQQQVRKQVLPARRGAILDRNGQALALSVPAPNIVANPSEIDDAVRVADALCAALEDCSVRERRRLRAGLGRGGGFFSVRRQASQDQADRVAGLMLKGIGFIEDSRRYYPNKELAAHVLGFVNLNHEGAAGIEYSYDKLIRGHDGFVVAQTDGNQSAFDLRIERAATTGATLELTIDESLQYVVERELSAGVLANNAAGGSAIVLDHWTGEILALANYPTFNPNAYRSASIESQRNRAVQDAYEPGSAFKIVTASAALEQDVVSPDDLIDTTGGRIAIGRKFIYDTHNHGVLSFSDAFVKSSNVGAIKVALELGPERLTDYIGRFGFGRRTWDVRGDGAARHRTHDFSAEGEGKVWAASELPDTELASVSIGYHVSVTALQMAAAVGSIANGGELVQPRIVRAVTENGTRRDVPRNVVNRTVTPGIAAEVTALMEGVVERGTATVAQIPGYTVAAKTGTAEKLVNGKYSKTEHNSSIVGFVPSRKPAYTIVVVIDSPDGPNGVYGGAVAGPIFRNIAEAALRHGAVPPTLHAPPPLLVRREPGGAREQPASGPILSPPAVASVAAVAAVAAVAGQLPDLAGMSARRALRTLSRLGLQPEVHGTGLVIGQRPPAGAPLESGVKATIWLGRQPPAVRTAGALEP